jgi:hypothetical protein
MKDVARMVGDFEKKKGYSIGRILSKDIKAEDLSVDSFNEWENNTNFKKYFDKNIKVNDEYFCESKH